MNLNSQFLSLLPQKFHLIPFVAEVRIAPKVSRCGKSAPAGEIHSLNVAALLQVAVMMEIFILRYFFPLFFAGFV